MSTSQHFKISAFLTLAVCTLIFFFGCDMDHKESFGVNNSYSVTAVSVTKWDDYKVDLQPNFVLSEADAYSKAVPTVSRVQDSLLNAFRTKVGVQLAPASALPAGFGKSGETFAGKDIPSGFTDDKSAPTGTAPDPFSADTKVDTNPYLTYLAATALYQEVKLIDCYVKDANLEQHYRPYIVQFLVNQDVRGTSKAFDTDILLSFFGTPVVDNSAEGGGLDPQTTADLQNRTVTALKSFETNTMKFVSPETFSSLTLLQQTLGTSKQHLTDEEIKSHKDRLTIQRANLEVKLREATEPQRPEITKALQQLDAVIGELARRESLKARTESIKTKLPLVKPMLVTDQVESSLRASRAEDLQQFGLALAAAYAGIGGNIDLENVSRQIRSALRTDIIERYSVSRVNDNTVRIHLGARQIPKVKGGKNGTDANEYYADEGNHRVSLLILVPEEWVRDSSQTVYFGAKIHLTDAASGKRFDASANTTVNAPLMQLAPTAEQKEKGVSGSTIFDASRLKLLGFIKDKDLDQTAFEKKVFGEEINSKENFLMKLESLVRTQRYKDFRSDLLNKYKPLINDTPDSLDGFDSLINSFWNELSEFGIGSRFAVGSFLANTYPAPAPSLGDATTPSVLALDDGKFTTLILPGVKDINAEKVGGVWTLTPKGMSEIKLAANGAKLDGKAQLRVQFPSLLDLKIPAPSPAPAPFSTIELKYEDPSISPAVPNKNINVIYTPTGDSKIAGITILSNTDKLPPGKDVALELDIQATDASPDTITGKNKVELNEANLKQFYILTFKGGVPVPADPKGALQRIDSMPQWSYAVTGKGLTKLTLQQLAAESTLTITIAAPKNFATPAQIVISVSK